MNQKIMLFVYVCFSHLCTQASENNILSKRATENALSQQADLAIKTGDTELLIQTLRSGYNRYSEETSSETLLHKVATIGGPHCLELADILLEAANDVLLEANFDINAQDNQGNTPLHNAITNNIGDLVTFFIERGAQLNKTNSQNETPLTLAIVHNQLDLVEKLTERGADINADPSLFQNACADEDFDRIKLLMRLGANIHKTNSQGKTELDKAFDKDKKDLVRVLIAAGARFKNVKEVRDTLLHKACQEGDIDFVRKLIQAQINLNLKRRLYSYDFSSLPDDFLPFPDDYSSLHIACEEDNSNLTQLLIEANIDVNIRDSSQATPLHIACREGHLGPAQILIKAGANINALNNDNAPPIYEAISSGCLDIFILLLTHKPNLEIPGFYGQTALCYAVHFGRMEILKILLNAGEQTDVRGDDGRTPLHIDDIIDRWPDVKIAQTLIEAGANPEIGDSQGNTPLHLAVDNGHTDFIKMLIKNKVHIDPINEDGQTPLHLALNSKYLDNCQALLDGGARADIRDYRGKTPLLLSILLNTQDMFCFLVKNSYRLFLPPESVLLSARNRFLARIYVFKKFKVPFLCQSRIVQSDPLASKDAAFTLLSYMKDGFWPKADFFADFKNEAVSYLLLAVKNELSSRNGTETIIDEIRQLINPDAIDSSLSRLILAGLEERWKNLKKTQQSATTDLSSVSTASNSARSVRSKIS